MSDVQRVIDSEKYDNAVQRLKNIVKPLGAWNIDMEIYFKNVIKYCVEQATAALEILGEEVPE